MLSVVDDDLGNTGTGGPLQDLASVAIHVASPSEQIAQLRLMVLDLAQRPVLNQGQVKSLIAKLDHGQLAVDRGMTRVAYNGLRSLRNEVGALVSARILTPEQGHALLVSVDLLLEGLLPGRRFLTADRGGQTRIRSSGFGFPSR